MFSKFLWLRVFVALPLQTALKYIAIAFKYSQDSKMLLYNSLQKSSGRLVGDLSVRASAGMLPRRIV